MFEEKPNQEAVAEKIDATWFKHFCRALRICEDEIAQIMNAPDKPTDATRSRRGGRS
jgi:hypothetical protein